MQQIINFFIRNKVFLLFLLLFTISISLTFQSHSYHKSKFINSANFLTGGVYESVSNFGQYLNLREENNKLLEENNRLKSLLFNTKNVLVIDTLSEKNYSLIQAKVLKNSYAASNNYLTINKGQKDSITEDLGVITSKGIVGIIDNTSNGYARVMSILNTNSRVTAQLKNTDHFGELRWDKNSPEIIQLIDIQKQVKITPGDTIITSGRSTIFPPKIPVGEVVSFKLDETENFYIVQVKLFNDMTNIGHVHIIKNLDSKEIKALENRDE